METLVMSRGERKRLEVFSRVASGELGLGKAAELLEVSYRQAKRIAARYRVEGDVGLVHRLRGRPSNRRPEDGRQERALALYREKYADYGPTLAAQCLSREDELTVPVTTLRRWLSEAGLWQRQRRRKVHRRRRPRREHAGELVQMDGSHHDWFEGRRPEAVLMVVIDDATSRAYGRFFEEETLEAAWETFDRYVQWHGLPQALYVDRHGIYRSDQEPTAEQVLAGEEPRTQFGRSMHELGVRLILAGSPQAKGRVERVNRTFQDRLVKEMRRLGISDLATANALLETSFLAEHNALFSKSPAAEADLHRPPPDSSELARVLCVHEERVVHPDWTVRWRGATLQLARSTARMVQPGDRVLVCDTRHGLRLFAGSEELPWQPAAHARYRPRRQRRQLDRPPRSNQGQKPAADHPWRRWVFRPPATPDVRPPRSASVAALPALREAGGS